MVNFPMDQVLIAGALLVVITGFYLRGQIKKRHIQAELESGALVIDVRSPGEFGSGHYASAINIPHDQMAVSLKKIGPCDRTIVVYCASGARSAAAAATLRSQGYTKVINAGRIGAMPA